MAGPVARAATTSLARPKYPTRLRALYTPGSAPASTPTTRRATPGRARPHAASHHKLFSTQTSTCTSTFAPQTSAPPPPPAPAAKQIDSRRLEPARRRAPTHATTSAVALLACCLAQRLLFAHCQHSHTHTTASRRERPPLTSEKDKMTKNDLKDNIRPHRQNTTYTTSHDIKDNPRPNNTHTRDQHSPHLFPPSHMTVEQLKNKNKISLCDSLF